MRDTAQQNSAETPDGSGHQTQPVGSWQLWGIRLGWVATFLVPAWILGVRLVLGTESTSSQILMLVLPGLLFLLSLFSLAIFSRTLAPVSRRVLTCLWIAYFCGFVLGWFIPDSTAFELGATQGDPSALVSVLFGPGLEGATAAISNPMAIIMCFSAALGAIFAGLDSRPTGPIRTTDEDEHQGTGYFPLLDEDS